VWCSVLQCVAVRCSVLQSVAVCLQCVAVNVLQTPGSLAAAIRGDAFGIVLQWLAVCCSVLQCVAVSCGALQCVAVMRGKAHGVV